MELKPKPVAAAERDADVHCVEDKDDGYDEEYDGGPYSRPPTVLWPLATTPLLL